jgi:hypothetical protein
MYNNNNRGGFYQNQNSANNPYRPQGQNIYQQMNNNFKPPQGPYQNNYNQGNYNPNLYNQQQNYGNQPQNQNVGPKPFITGAIGRCKISAEDVQSFSKNIKNVEWTSNANYLQVQDINVRTKIMGQGENENKVFMPRHRFNDYYISSNFKPDEIIAFIAEVTDTNKRIDQIGNPLMQMINGNPNIGGSPSYEQYPTVGDTPNGQGQPGQRL